MKRQRGFSLLEVMLAITIVLALAGTVYAFLFDLIDSRERIVSESDRSRVGIGVIEQLERGIMTTIAGSSRYGSGVRGSPNSLELLSRAVTLPVETDSQTVLGDLQGVSFSWDSQRGVLSASRWDELGGERSGTEVISSDIAYLQFRYYDGQAWRGRFDSSSGLPVAIEVAIWFGEPEFLDDPGAGFDDEQAAMDEFDQMGFGESAAGFEEIELEVLVPTREPDRVRVMVIPDGPSVGWEDGS
jgi:prepilin-type N-terminal cleavage/methylation domain-containing protein